MLDAPMQLLLCVQPQIIFVKEVAQPMLPLNIS